MLNNKIENLKNEIKEIENVKKGIENFINIYNNKYANIVGIQNDIKKDLLDLEKLNTLNNNQEGVVIDYKTFSEIVNVLSIAKSYGDCSQDFFNKVINIGMSQEKKEQTQSLYLETIKQRMNDKDRLGSKFTLEPVGQNDDNSDLPQDEFERLLIERLGKIFKNDEIKFIKI